MIIYALMVTIIAVIITLIVAGEVSKTKQLSQKEKKGFACTLCDYTSEIESECIEHMVKVHAANEDKCLVK